MRLGFLLHFFVLLLLFFALTDNLRLCCCSRSSGLGVQLLIESRELFHGQPSRLLSFAHRSCFLKEPDDIAFAEDEGLLDFEEGRNEDVWLLKVVTQLIVIMAEQFGDDEEERVFSILPHQPGFGLFVSEVHRGVLTEAIEDDECGVGTKHGDGLGKQLLESVELRSERVEEHGVFHCVEVIIREGEDGEWSGVAGERVFCNDQLNVAILERKRRR